MYSIHIISVNKFLIPFLHTFQIHINCGSQKMSDFEKWLGLSRILVTPGVWNW